MITLIEKKDKDKRLLKNWRPISLINVDVKIISKVMAMRLESILPFLVHHSQNAFIKGSWSIDDILEYAKRNNRTGILVAIDFEKAFDSLNRTFLVKVLQKFNFGIYFSQWIQTFYTVTKNRCVTHVKIRGYANLVSSLLAYLISAV